MFFANYSYLSDGTKLSATDASGNGLCYLGSLVYNKQGNRLTLESAAVPGGRIITTNNGYDTRYFLTDHLGSVRAVVNNNGIVQEQSNYYAYGSRWNDGQMSDNRYLFNGKEAQSFVNLPYSDYGARQYDPNTGRWFNNDPLAEKYFPISPYVYCANNPICLIDPTGMEWAYYSVDGKSDPTWNWVDGSEYRTGVKDDDGNEIVLQAYDAVVVFEGSEDETLGSDGTLTGEGANPAKVTIYGINGQDDIATHNGLTVSSNPEIYPMVKSGDYLAYQEQMPTSIYAKDALSYRVTTMGGNTLIPPAGGINKRTGESYITGEYFHRTDWSGRATKSSQACLIVDGRSWKKVQKQIGKSKNIFIRVNR